MNFDVITDDGAGVDEDIVAEVAVFADYGALTHVAVVPDTRVSTNGRAALDFSGGVDHVPVSRRSLLLPCRRQ